MQFCIIQLNCHASHREKTGPNRFLGDYYGDSFLSTNYLSQLSVEEGGVEFNMCGQVQYN